MRQHSKSPHYLTGFWVFLGGHFLCIFSDFAIDRSKKYIKTIKNYIKIDAVNPQAAADTPPPTPR